MYSVQGGTQEYLLQELMGRQSQASQLIGYIRQPYWREQLSVGQEPTASTTSLKQSVTHSGIMNASEADRECRKFFLLPGPQAGP